jgi:hypothetical protein
VPPAGRITHPDRTLVETVWMTLKELTPSILVNGMLYAAPSWVRFTDLAFGAVALLTGFAWLLTEGYWAGYVRAPDRLSALRPGRSS